MIPPGTNLNGDTKLARLEAALCEMAEFRFNTITRFPEIKDKAAADWKRLDDYMLNSIVRALKKQGVPYAAKTRVGELLESDFSRKSTRSGNILKTWHRRKATRLGKWLPP
ncbi:MAG: hypothetical protein IPK76_15660 [Lewinellaceae bacterium]|nr:hypothetical protein [Lewinellaceae bacterium]